MMSLPRCSELVLGTFAVALALAILTVPGLAQCDPPGENTKCWDDGDPGTHHWSSALNWNPDGVPEPTDHVVTLQPSARFSEIFPL